MQNNVTEALQVAVTTAVSNSLDSTLPVKYLGRSLQTATTDKWLEIVHIPNNIENQYWGDSKTYRGILRLILHWPNNDEGLNEPTLLLQSILDYFEKGKKIQDTGDTVNVSITEIPDMMPIMEEESEMMLPSTIRYNFFNS